MNSVSSVDWSLVRTRFPVVQRHVYLNHAGVSPLGTHVTGAMRAALHRLECDGAADYRSFVRRIEEVREALGRLVGAEARDIAFVKNTTQGLIIAAESIPWQAGDNCVITDLEFPANVYPWLHLKRRDIETRIVPAVEGRIIVDDLVAAMDRRTRALAISWVEFSTGFRNNLEILGQLCAERGIFFVVDAIQGLGALQMKVERCGIDFLAADGHKFLLGPEGCGLLYCTDSPKADLRPTNVGWGSVVNPDDYLTYDLTLKDDASRFEEGSLNVVGIHGLGASVEYFLQLGPPAIEERVLSLSDLLVEKLQAAGALITSSRATEERSPIVCFNLASVPPDEVQRRLRAAGIVCAVRGGAVRLSLHMYNNEDDFDRVIHALSTIAD